LSKIKITYIISGIEKARAFEWIVENINPNSYDVSFILLNKKKSFFYNWLKQRGLKTTFIKQKNSGSLPLIFIKILIQLIKNRPDVVHTHLFDANITGLLAAKILGIRKRIYTRHHSTYHFEYYPKGIKFDKLCNFLATQIIAISENVRTVLIQKESVNKNKIILIHHGFDLNEFTNVDERRVELLRNKYSIPKDRKPVIGVISRQMEWKGIQYIIPAFSELLKKYPQSYLILANANGPYKEEINRLIKIYHIENYVLEIAFENDLFALYKLFDIYVHVPINGEIEAFGQTYVEALASGIPSVFTLSGIAKEFIVTEKNAMVVDFCNSSEIVGAIDHIIRDEQLKESIIHQGMADVKIFGLKPFIKKLENLYA